MAMCLWSNWCIEIGKQLTRCCDGYAVDVVSSGLVDLFVCIYLHIDTSFKAYCYGTITYLMTKYSIIFLFGIKYWVVVLALLNPTFDIRLFMTIIEIWC